MFSWKLTHYCHIASRDIWIIFFVLGLHEYYANKSALKKAAKNWKAVDSKTNSNKSGEISVVEAFGSDSSNKETVPVRDLKDGCALSAEVNR